jgi:hypothetical protein
VPLGARVTPPTILYVTSYNLGRHCVADRVWTIDASLEMYWSEGVENALPLRDARPEIPSDLFSPDAVP